ncbi:hypothetical protein P4284_09090 [Bacillus swezeyi]|nr:hypothetical protein [Bacillus swezeyi]MED2976851.1 hypothetical protein [Bacillus swezeyi]
MKYNPLQRWQWQGGIETSVPQHIARALSERGIRSNGRLIPDHLEGGR